PGARPPDPTPGQTAGHALFSERSVEVGVTARTREEAEVGKVQLSLQSVAAAAALALLAVAAPLPLRASARGASAAIARVQDAIDERESLAVGDRHRDRRRSRGGLVLADDDEA